VSHALARDVLATSAHLLSRASASFRLTLTQILADGICLAQLQTAAAASVQGKP
jgi:hypothetical protein